MNEKTMRGGSRHVRTGRPLIRDGLRRMAANIEYCARRRARARLAELMGPWAVETGLIMYDGSPAERLDGRGAAVGILGRSGAAAQLHPRRGRHWDVGRSHHRG